MPRPTRILTWLMLAMLVGGHWGMLQMVAWTGMLIDYSRDNSFATAVAMTFDGEHPCAICHEVDRGIAADLGSDDDQAPGKVVKTVKLDALVTQVELIVPLHNAAQLPTTYPRQHREGLVWEPLLRPPRRMV
jgi:hypothetical protein